MMFLRLIRRRHSAAQRWLLALTAVGVLLAIPAQAQDHGAAEAAFKHFEQNVATYLAFRDRVLTSAPKLSVTSNPAMLQRRVNDFAERIRMARQHARPGDIFSNDIAIAFPHRISETMREHAQSATKLLASINDDTSRIDKRSIAVNERFPWNLGSQIPAEILAVLPRLPDALEYRFVNRDLVIVDLQADLIVDILPGAVQGR